jgi:DeoR family ulaG and ulaABCDEF operon transcriptional repressor
MHYRQRQRAIVGLLRQQPLVTVRELTQRLAASEATVRRDIARLAAHGALKRVHGGAEALLDAPTTLRGQPFNITQTLHVREKRAIGQAAATLCQKGDALTINGGSTTYMMAEFLAPEHLHILTNALPIAQYLIEHTHNRVMLPGGEIFREQNIILSPFETDSMNNFHAAKVFIGAQSVGPRGFMETDSILIRAEQKLMGQGD